MIAYISWIMIPRIDQAPNTRIHSIIQYIFPLINKNLIPIPQYPIPARANKVFSLVIASFPILHPLHHPPLASIAPIPLQLLHHFHLLQISCTSATFAPLATSRILWIFCNLLQPLATSRSSATSCNFKIVDEVYYWGLNQYKNKWILILLFFVIRSFIHRTE